MSSSLPTRAALVVTLPMMTRSGGQPSEAEQNWLLGNSLTYLHDM